MNACHLIFFWFPMTSPSKMTFYHSSIMQKSKLSSYWPGFVKVFASVGHPTGSPKTLPQWSCSHINKLQFLVKGIYQIESTVLNSVLMWNANRETFDLLVWGVPPAHSQSCAGWAGQTPSRNLPLPRRRKGQVQHGPGNRKWRRVIRTMVLLHLMGTPIKDQLISKNFILTFESTKRSLHWLRGSSAL